MQCNPTVSTEMMCFFKKVRLRDFGRDQDGAATIDWVVLTAAAAMLGLGSAFLVASEVPEVGQAIGDYANAMDPSGASYASQMD